MDFTQFVPTDSLTKAPEDTAEKFKFNDTESPWLFNGKPLEVAPKGHTTFVYLITNKINGLRYIGFKTLMSKKTKTVKKEKVRFTEESDWKAYWSSSENLRADVAYYGKGNFLREILAFTVNKAVGKYIEADEQFKRKVLTENAQQYYNGIVNLRIGKITLKAYKDVIYTQKLLGDKLAYQKGFK